MKNTFLILILTVSCIFIGGCASSFNIPDAEKQPKAITEEENNKIKQAVMYHDAGDYDKAISIYQELLNSNPDNVTALYEISLSLYNKKEYQKCLDYAVKGMQYDSKHLNGFYGEAGNCLDNLGRAKEAISVYKKGIKLFPNDYSLHYNLGITYINLQKPEEAEESLINTIKTNKFHPSSHLALAILYMKQQKQIPSLLLLCRFLTLEPNSARSQQAVSMIDEIINWGVQKKDDNNISINIFDTGNNKSPYTTLELFLRLKKAAGIAGDNNEQTIVKTRVDDLSSLISVIGKNNGKQGDFTADYLFPYFSEMNSSKNAETFVYFIHQSAGNADINSWLNNHKDKVDSFLSWNENYKWEKK